MIIQLANASNFICDHQSFCHVNCYERQRRSCARLVAALHRVYSSSKQLQLSEQQGSSCSEQAGGCGGGGWQGGGALGGGGGGTTAKDRLKRRVSRGGGIRHGGDIVN